MQGYVKADAFNSNAIQEAIDNAEAKMFSNQETKVKTEEHIEKALLNEEKYVTKEEFDKKLNEYLQIAKDNQSDIKEILRYLRKK